MLLPFYNATIVILILEIKVVLITPRIIKKCTKMTILRLILIECMNEFDKFSQKMLT